MNIMGGMAPPGFLSMELYRSRRARDTIKQLYVHEKHLLYKQKRVIFTCILKHFGNTKWNLIFKKLYYKILMIKKQFSLNLLAGVFI